MSILTQSEDINLNYAPSIEKIDKVEPHPNADALQYAIINDQRIIVGNDLKVGDYVVYFPLETQIDSKYLRENNLYATPALNADPTQKGFFTDKSRVRCIKLRGEYSMGFVAPVETLEIAYPSTENNIWVVGQKFDTIDGKKIAWKYVVETPQQQPNSQKRYNKSMRRLDRFDRMVPGQFKFHYDTEQLDRNLAHFWPQNVITLTTKLDGTSIIISNILVKKELKGIKKFLNKIGLYKIPTYYDNIFSTRRVIQNRDINTNDFTSFYNVPIHKIANDALKDFIPEGVTLYGELVGYIDGSNKCIQSKHDYGCKPGKWAVMPYRITYTNEKGDVTEASVPAVNRITREIKSQLKDAGLDDSILMEMEIKYQGRAGDMYNLYKGGSVSEWRQQWLEKMRNDREWLLMEESEPLCVNKVPREGYVIRIYDDPLARAWKLKSKAHFAKETAALDKGETNIEDQA